MTSGIRLAYELGQAAAEFRRSYHIAHSAMQRDVDPKQPHDVDVAAGREDAYREVLRRLDLVIAVAERDR